MNEENSVGVCRQAGEEAGGEADASLKKRKQGKHGRHTEEEIGERIAGHSNLSRY